MVNEKIIKAMNERAKLTREFHKAINEGSRAKTDLEIAQKRFKKLDKQMKIVKENFNLFINQFEKDFPKGSIGQKLWDKLKMV